jgi:hypothetical protein
LAVASSRIPGDAASTHGSFQSDELPLLESFGELGEIAPGEDAMPFGAGFVLALVVLPAFLGCDVEDDVHPSTSSQHKRPAQPCSFLSALALSAIPDAADGTSQFDKPSRQD